jgi:hypothetical protein
MPGAIVVRPVNGLCNRLTVVSSFAALARRCNRELYLCWAASPGWSDEDMEDLFENRFSRLSAEDFEQASTTALCLHRQVTVTGVGGLSEAWKSVNGLGLDAVFDSSAYPVVSYRGFRPCQDLLAPSDRRRLLPGFGRDFEDELRAWRPVRTIRDRVAEVAGAFSSETVGVHIRRGDAMRHPRLAEQYGRSSDAAFMARMDRIVRSRPSRSFFLATDCPDTQRRFQDRYGSLILTNADKRFVPSIYRAPKANQHDAVIDLFALARTRTILGNYYSTFSGTAAALGGAQLKVVVDGTRLAQLRRRATYGLRRASAGG